MVKRKLPPPDPGANNRLAQWAKPAPKAAGQPVLLVDAAQVPFAPSVAAAGGDGDVESDTSQQKRMLAENSRAPAAAASGDRDVEGDMSQQKQTLAENSSAPSTSAVSGDRDVEGDASQQQELTESARVLVHVSEPPPSASANSRPTRISLDSLISQPECNMSDSAGEQVKKLEIDLPKANTDQGSNDQGTLSVLDMAAPIFSGLVLLVLVFVGFIFGFGVYLWLTGISKNTKAL